MNIVVDKQPKCIASLRAEIPAETVKATRDKIVGTYAAKANIPGFRPGKAPRTVIEKRFKKDIDAELKEDLINDAITQAIADNDLKVIDFGALDTFEIQADGAAQVGVDLLLCPDITLPDYHGMTVKSPSADVPAEELEAQLENLRERFADFNAITDRPAQAGDVAVIDYSSTLDGQPTEEALGKSVGYIAGRESFWLKLDEKVFLPGFAMQLVGMNPGEERQVTITLPEDFPVGELAQRELVFQVKLTEIKESVLPALDDSLAEKLSPGKTMEEIKDIIRENMTNERKRRFDDHKVDQIVDQLCAAVECELPDELLARETQSQVDKLVQGRLQAGATDEEIQGQQAEIFAAASAQAAQNLKTNFILREIALKEAIQVDDSELIAHLAQIAASRQEQPKQFIRQLQRERRVESIRGSMVVGKTIDFLLEHANVEEANETPSAE